MASSRRTGPTMLAPSGSNMALQGHVGFDNLVSQAIKRAVMRGFTLNIVLLGETATGKSTLLASLFNTQFEEAERKHSRDRVDVSCKQYLLREGETKLRLNVAEVLGFGDQLDRSNGLEPVKEFVLEQFRAYLDKEMAKERAMHSYHDTRCHVCLYFISPTGKSLKSLDLVALKELGQIMNVIPVIAKADSLSLPDLLAFKKQVMADLQENNIQIYHLPLWDQAIADRNEELEARMPLSVVGSMAMQGNKRVRAYPWGVVEVENEAHSDFLSLREVLLHLNTLDLINMTHEVHYANFRRLMMVKLGYLEKAQDGQEASLQATYEARHAMFMEKKQKKEQEMRALLAQQIKDKESELRQAGARLKQKFETQRQDLEAELENYRQLIGSLERTIEDQKAHMATLGKRSSRKTSFLG